MSRLVEIVKARLFAGQLLKTDTDNLMLHRSSFPAYQQNGTPAGNSGIAPQFGELHSGDGRSSGPKMTPSPFVPNYSGDGHGKIAGWSGDGQGSSEPQPVWSGGGRHDVHNPMMPTWGKSNFGPVNMGASNGVHAAGRFGQRAEDHPAVAAASAPAREESNTSRQVPLSDELVMNVNMRNSGDGAFEAMNATGKTAGKSSGTWKLIALVVVFLVWVSTASTLLFLYMDRYLFP